MLILNQVRKRARSSGRSFDLDLVLTRKQGKPCRKEKRNNPLLDERKTTNNFRNVLGRKFVVLLDVSGHKKKVIH